VGIMATWCIASHTFHKTVDHLLSPAFSKAMVSLLPSIFTMAVAEFLVKHAVVQRELGDGAGGFRDQFALDTIGPRLVREDEKDD
jgi:hypothetical protein